MEWFRMYHEARKDEKLDYLSDAEFRVWFRMMCFANEQKPRGRIPLRSDFLMAIDLSKGDETLWKRCRNVFETLHIIQIEGETIKIINWDKRQFKSDNSSDRVRRHRDSKRNVTETLQQRDGNVGHSVKDLQSNRVTEIQIKEERVSGETQKVVKAWEETFGKLQGDPSRIMNLLDYMDEGMDVELVVKAIHKSSDADRPVKYADGILNNWRRRGYKTIADVDGGEADGKHIGNSKGNRGSGLKELPIKPGVIR